MQTTKQNRHTKPPHHLFPHRMESSRVQRRTPTFNLHELAQKNKHRLLNCPTRLHQHAKNKRGKLRRNKKRGIPRLSGNVN